ncbi:MAG: protein kinase, partial [Caldilineaceae bacterium]|nr:protein kinase [Caldilineaceae bacterium]
MDSKQTNIGPFRIQANLRREGGAAVYRVLDTRINHPRLLYTFALNSSLGPTAGEVLLNEARALLHLQHERLIAPREADRDGDLIYVATEPINGISLADHLYQMGGILALSEAADIVQDVAECLDYVHREGLVHGQLTPGEIWLTTNGQAKLAGIGLPGAFSAALAGAATDAARGVALTPYTAPEQAAAELATDQRVDVYSLGAVAFAMLTGSAPFDENADNLRDQIAYRPPTPPETLNLRLPPNVASVLRFVLAKDPNARYTRAGEFAAALRQAQLWSGGEFATLTRNMPSTGRKPASSAGARRQRNLVALFALLLVVALAGILLSQRAFQREASSGQEALTPDSPATTQTPIAIAQVEQVDEETPADSNTLPNTPEAEDDPPAVSAPSADAPTTGSVIADGAGISETETITESASAEVEPTATATAPPTPTDTNTPAPTETETSVATATLTPSATDTPSATPLATATATEMPSPTDTTAPTLEVTAAAAQSLILAPTDTPSATPEATATPTDTPAPTNTHTATATDTPPPTDTPAPTNTHTATATDTPPPTD